MRIRVFAGIGVAAALLSLTACRSSPTVAAYVDDEQFTEDRVTALFDGFGSSQTDRLIIRDLGLRPEANSWRATIVDYLVGDRVCETARQKLNFQVQQFDLADDVSELGRILLRAEACQRAVPVGEPVRPTEADARQVFNLGVAKGVWPAGAESEVIASLLNDQAFIDALSRKKVLNDATAGTRVTINPKYGTADVSLIRFPDGSPAVVLTFGSAGPVENRPTEPSAAARPL